MYNDLRNIHIGELIRQRLVHLSMSYAEFARRLHIERTTVYSIVRSKSIDIERLIRISQILDYDFISLVYQDSAPSQCQITISVEAARELLAGRPITVTADQ